VLRDLLKDHGDYALAHAALGLVMREQGKEEEALEASREAVRLNPRLDLAYHTLGEIFLQRGDLHRAEDYLGKAVAVDPQAPDGLFWMGELRLRQGRKGEARELLERALENKQVGEKFSNVGIDQILDKLALITGRKE